MVEVLSADESELPEEDGHLPFAPIVEAIIGVEFTNGAADVESLSSQLEEALDHSYIGLELGASRKVQLHPPPNPIIEETTRLLRFRSEDGLNVFTVMQGAFVFSRLAPYSNWNDFRNEARTVWTALRGLLPQLKLDRASLRYINKLNVPADEPIEKYLKLYFAVPDAPSGGAQAVTGVYLRVQIPLVEPFGDLIVQEVLLPPEREGFQTWALDNDLQFSLVDQADDELWKVFEKARRIKNRYFRHFITPTLLETYK